MLARLVNKLPLPFPPPSLPSQYYTDTLDATIAQLKSEGKYDAGIVTIKGRSCTVVGKKPIYKDSTSGAEVRACNCGLHLTWEMAQANKGMSACARWNGCRGASDCTCGMHCVPNRLLELLSSGQ